jgi:hypothetical protein
VTPPLVFAKVMSEVVEEYRQRGIEKPVVASLAGDVEVEEASQYLFEHGIRRSRTRRRRRSRSWRPSTAGHVWRGS